MSGNVRIPPIGTIRPDHLNFKFGKAGLTVAASDASTLEKAVADYICDGTDDDVQFQAAINALPTAGGRVIFTAGTYSLTNSVFIKSKITLQFENGNAVTISNSHSFDSDSDNQFTKNTDVCVAAFTNKLHDGTESDIRIIGMNLNYGSPIGSSKFAKNKSYYGIWLDQCSNSIIENCKVSYVIEDGLSDVGRAFGILISDCINCQILSCIATNCGYEGLSIRGSNEHCIVNRCYTINNKIVGCQVACWSPTYAGNFRNILISENNFIGGFTIHGRAGGSSGQVVANNNTIAANGIGSGKIGLIGSLSGVQVCNNSLVGTASYPTAIELYNNYDVTGDASIIENICISGNTVLNTLGGYAGGIGVFSKKDSGAGYIKNISITDNTLMGRGIYVYTSSANEGTGTPISNIKIAQNNISIPSTITTGTYGISISTSVDLGLISNIQITSNNIVNECSTVNGIIGIIIQSLTNASIKNIRISDNNVIVNNYSSGNSIALQITESATTEIGNIEDVWIVNNTLVGDSYRGLYFNKTGNASLVDVHVLQNTFGGSATGIIVNGVVGFGEFAFNDFSGCIYGIRRADGTGDTFTEFICTQNDFKGLIVANCIYFQTLPTISKIEKNRGYKTENYGTSIGTGLQQTIAHGMAVIPNIVIISGDATKIDAFQSAAADATNIYVTADNGEAYHWEAIAR